MSKQLTVVVPDNYNLDNLKIRIEKCFDDDPKIKVLTTERIDTYVGEVILAIGELQEKLKRLS